MLRGSITSDALDVLDDRAGVPSINTGFGNEQELFANRGFKAEVHGEVLQVYCTSIGLAYQSLNRRFDQLALLPAPPFPVQT